MRKPGKAAQRAARQERLSAALRENLKRRKAQARGRAAGVAVEDGDQADADAAPIESNTPESAPKTPDFRRNRGND